MDRIILSLGGSLIAPEDVNASFLKNFRATILENLERHHFVIFTGGGKPARMYQTGLAATIEASNEQLDWIGIHASRLNAQLIGLLFDGYISPEIIIDPTISYDLSQPIMIGAGWKPGWSTDYDAVAFAAGHGIKRVVNLSNITQAYNKDPKQYPDATPIDDITWDDFRKIVGDVWKPGLNSPFDPIASQLAQQHGIEVIIADGTNLENLQTIMDNGAFVGTRIHN